MFDLNKDIIYKMGWAKYSSPLSGFGVGGKIFNDDPLVKHYINFELQNLLYVIKKDKKLIYKFIKVDYSDDDNIKFQSYSFSSNIGMFKLIRNNLACNSRYQRFFQINHIIK